MPLTKYRIKPGFNKQATESEAIGQWTDGDFVRFRYGQPEKIGGWTSLVSGAYSSIIGAARDQHVWSDLDGNKYSAMGTNKLLIIYYEGAFYDITPLQTDNYSTGANITTTNLQKDVTITTSGGHNLIPGDIITFANAGSFTPPDTDYTATDFDDVLFEVKTVPSATTFTIQMPTDETGTGATNDGTLDVHPYEPIGPLNQTYGYGWGTSTWSRLTWGSASASSNVVLDPANWSLDNWGQILIATIHNGRSFTWDPTSGLTTRAVLNTNMPSRSVMSIVSDRDRHLIHLGTEIIIGTPSKQDKMFIRFSDQEDYDVYAPTSVNTAGTFQLDDGTKIVGATKGKDYIMVFTDTATYRMDFVGPPFTFSIRKVASNAGLIGQHAAVYANGAMWWMGATGGFYVYDGTVKSVPCLVEDFVFTNNGAGDLGLNYNSGEIIYAGINELYSEVNWFYPSD
jgi:hypothetical protein